MSWPPEDLPRSPSGRTPQWVHDDAADPATPSPPWRGSTPTPITTRERLSGRAVLAWLVPFIVVVALLGRWAGQQLDGVVAAPPEVAYGVEHEQAPPPPLELRGTPRPYEEASEPLGVPPRPADGRAPHEFLQTWTDANGLPVPVAWSPCRPIHYVVDPTGAPADFTERVAAVIGELSAATGLKFVDDGVTSEPASARREVFQPDVYGDRWAPALIRFTDGSEIPEFEEQYGGLGGSVSVTSPVTSVPHYVSGFAYLNLSLLSSRDVAGEPAYVGVLRHELGHMIGLGHVDDRAQLMYGEGNAVTTFQDGDLAGLAALGYGRCAPGL